MSADPPLRREPDAGAWRLVLRRPRLSATLRYFEFSLFAATIFAPVLHPTPLWILELSTEWPPHILSLAAK